MSDPLPHLLAKSRRGGRPAESLTSHLHATLQATASLRERTGRLWVVDTLGGEPPEGHSRFWDAVLLAALAHDAGKLADGFQQMLRDGTRWGHRHEVVSLGFLAALVPDESLRLWVAGAVVTHHRPLLGGRESIELRYGKYGPDKLRQQLGAIRPEDARALAEWLAATASAAGLPAGHPGSAPDDPSDVGGRAHALLQQVLDEWDLPAGGLGDLDRGLAAVLLQGAVTLADHLSSAYGSSSVHESLRTDQPVAAGFGPLLRRRIDPLYPHQQRAGELDGHLLLRAPTGSGKTEGGLLWAARQVVAIAAATGGTPRVFHTLPYLASINAMTDRLVRLLDADPDTVGVSHSRAASYHLSTAIAAEDGGREHDPQRVARKALSRAEATRLFRETVRVGTPYQLLRGALAGTAHSGILVDSANSVFILDELHAYDARRLGYILATVRLWERLGGRVAVLSATLPDALAGLVRETLHGNVELVDAGDAAASPRHRLRVRRHQLTEPDTIAEARQRLADQQAVLVVANNVQQAQELFDSLAPVAREQYGDDAAILLHSRFRRCDRSQIEGRIRDRYGVGAPRRPGLVVATQVVEVSLDVDFDVLFTSAAPLEALLQRFGRVNRLGQRPPADVIVHTPEYRSRRGESGEFADGVYPRPPVESGWDILTRYADQVVDEAQASGWLDEVYSTPWGEQWRADVHSKRQDFENLFLTFHYPYGDREELADRFDEMFEGTEVILAEDQDEYVAALTAVSRRDGSPDRAAGRLLAEEYLIPLPYWAATVSTYLRQYGIRVIDGEYDPERGLRSVRRPDRAEEQAYRLGEVL